MDEYTVRFHFPEPYELFPERLPVERSRYHPASHYLKQFHPEFTDNENLDGIVREIGYDDWTELLRVVAGRDRILMPDVPSLNAWVAANDRNALAFVMTRNPYFWQVDTAGRQLPYIDDVIVTSASNQQAMMLRALAGEIDFQFFDFIFWNDSFVEFNYDKFVDSLSVLLEKEESSDYRTLYNGIRGDWPALGVVDAKLRNVRSMQHITTSEVHRGISFPSSSSTRNESKRVSRRV